MIKSLPSDLQESNGTLVSVYRRRLKLDIVPFKLEAVVQKVMSGLEMQARQKGLNLSLNINLEGPDKQTKGQPY